MKGGCNGRHELRHLLLDEAVGLVADIEIQNDFFDAGCFDPFQSLNDLRGRAEQNRFVAERFLRHAVEDFDDLHELFLGSTCVYPRITPQPISEDYLLTGPLEPTNEWYAIAKIAGIKLCDAYRRQYGCDFISAQPTNLYGPYDNFDLLDSHVLPALIRRVHEAKLSGADSVEIWGSGKPTRDFLHVDDLADALVFLMKNYSQAGHINFGTGEEITIIALARMIAEIVGFNGRFVTNTEKPDGTPRKVTDIRKLSALGWRASVPLKEGIASTYRWYLDNRATPDVRQAS